MKKLTHILDWLNGNDIFKSFDEHHITARELENQVNNRSLFILSTLAATALTLMIAVAVINQNFKG